MQNDRFSDLLVYEELEYVMNQILSTTPSNNTAAITVATVTKTTTYKAICANVSPVEILRFILQIGFYEDITRITKPEILTEFIYKRDLIEILYEALGYEEGTEN